MQEISLRWVAASIVVLIGATLALLPIAQHPAPVMPGLVGLFGAGVAVTEFATSFLLFASSKAENRKSLQILAAAYLYSALMAVSHVLTFPGALLPDLPVIATPLQGPAWIFLFWVAVFAVICLAAVIAEVAGRQKAPAIVGPVALVTAPSILALSLTLMAMLVADRLPDVLVSGSRWSGINFVATSFSLLAFAVSIVLILVRARTRSAVFVWLALALTALLCANLLSAAGGGRYTLGWTIGRFFWLISACVLLIYFLDVHVRQQEALQRVTLDLKNLVARRTAELSASDARLVAIVSSTSDAILTKSLDGTILSWNPAAERLLCYAADEIVGRSVRNLVPQSLQEDEDQILTRISAGELVDSYETERIGKHGRKVEVSLTVSPLIVDGQLIGASSIMHDISVRKQRERHNALLLREVNHRSKNMLAVVQAIARQTVAGAPEAFLSSFSDRIGALAASHDLLVESEWQGVELGQLVTAELGRFQDLLDSRIEIGGPSVRLSPAAAQTIGMALHELATNAGKYGALANDKGRVEICWKLTEYDSGARVQLRWSEQGGPLVSPPSREGFGTMLIREVPAKSLKAEVELRYEQSGLVWSLDAPADAVLDPGAIKPNTEPSSV